MFRRSKYILFILVFLCLAFPALAQDSFRVLFWNFENLFDCKDDLKKNDNEFLPDATRHWTYFRYRDKVKNLAKAIIASGNEYVPDLVGLCSASWSICLESGYAWFGGNFFQFGFYQDGRW